MESFADALAMVTALRPEEPVYCLRPRVLRDTAAEFQRQFPGTVMYAVKCNDHPAVLAGLHTGGLRHFDVASLSEIEAVAALPGTVSHYMHPVKNRQAVELAYHRFGIRTFALDHEEELDKILAVTGGARDLTLVLRVDMPRFDSVCDLSGKFGAEVEAAPGLLRRIAATGNRAGLTFHVGSQCLDPGAYESALTICAGILARAGVPVPVVDVGGGFPAAYVGTEAPPLSAFVAAIRAGLARLPADPGRAVFCEPGRALVAEACSLVVKVEFRRGHRLYLNDGAYGSLADMKLFRTVYPVRLLRPGGAGGKPASFALFGPTCDSYDSLPGTSPLPEDVREGDWIEFGQIGAYSNVLQTRFNGFEARRFVAVDDGALRPAAARAA
jgi:ornithine decarboxylase